MLTSLYSLTADLLDALEREQQRRLPTTQHLAVQELLRRLPPDYPPADLPLLLVPLLAHNPAEQERLRELFEVCRRERAAMEAPEPTAATPTVDREERRWRRRIWIPAAVLLLAVGVGLAYWFWPEPPAPVIAENNTGLPTTTTQVLDTQVVNPNQRLFETKFLPYPHEFKPRPEPPAWKSWLATHWVWLRWLLLATFTLMLLALWRYLEYRRRKYVAEQDRRDKPPYAWNIRIDGADEVALGEGFAHALQVLRRRAATDAQALDLPRTISATAESGGMPDFRYRRRTQSVDYLLLIDRQSSQNHRARLFDRLYEIFQAQEIEIARFFYDADLRVCYNEEYPQGVALSELQGRYGLARLMLVGTGAQLLHPVTGRLAPWTGLLGGWKERVLLTPKALLDWGREERRLAELLTVLPATLQSLAFWVEELEQGQDARFEEWRERVQDAPLTPMRPDPADPLPTLQLAYGDRLLRWIAACAIYPTLHWDLTLWLGRLLSNPAEPEELVTLDSLLHLFRLPWFVQGEMPKETRIALLAWFDAHAPALLLHLRGEVARLLSQNPPPRDSAAWDEYRLHVALQEWLAAPKGPEKKKLEQEIAQLLAAGAQADITVVKELERPQSPLDFLVPKAWKKFIHPSGFPALGWLNRWRDLRWLLPLWLLGCVALFWPYGFMNPPECAGAVTYRGQEYCLTSARDSLLWLEQLALDTIRAQDLPGLDSLHRQATALASRSGDTLWPQVNANLAVAVYNEGVSYYQRQPDGPYDEACRFFSHTGRFDSLSVFPASGVDDVKRSLAQAKALCAGGADAAQYTNKVVFDFYYENSASMDGYLNGKTEFIDATLGLITRAKLQKAEVNLNYINKDVYPVDSIIQNYKDFLEPAIVRKFGNRGNREINRILKTVADSAIRHPDHLAVVISDYIYSIQGKKVRDQLDLQKNTTALCLAELPSHDFSILIVKINSDFNGTFYDMFNHKVIIHEKRPVYFWIIGKRERIIDFPQKYRLSEFQGYDTHLILLSEAKSDVTPYYTVLLKTFRKGRFGKADRGAKVVTTLESPQPSSEGDFQLGIAVDFSRCPAREDYFSDPKNYAVVSDVGDKFEMSEIQPIEDLDNNDIRQKGTATHILVLKTVGKISKGRQTVRIVLKKQMPAWVSNSSTESDVTPEERKEKTFGLQYLVEGAMMSYDYNKESIYDSFQITIEN